MNEGEKGKEENKGARMVSEKKNGKRKKEMVKQGER